MVPMWHPSCQQQAPPQASHSCGTNGPAVCRLLPRKGDTDRTKGIFLEGDIGWIFTWPLSGGFWKVYATGFEFDGMSLQTRLNGLGGLNSTIWIVPPVLSSLAFIIIFLLDEWEEHKECINIIFNRCLQKKDSSLFFIRLWTHWNFLEVCERGPPACLSLKENQI